MPGQLPALARLRALRHLDLELVGACQVVDVHAEAAGRDLLDLRTPVVAEPRRVLAAFTGVRAPADAVHRLRERLVRLAREGAERHRAGREALDDLGRRLDLVERDRLPRPEAEQPAQGRPAGGVGVHRRCELLVGRASSATHGVLEERDRLGVPLVMLAVAAPGVQTDDGQELVGALRVCPRVPYQRALGDLGQPDAADPRRRAGEVALDELAREADCFEHLRAAIGRQGRDAHLRDRLQQPLADGTDRPRLGVVPLTELAHRREHHVRVHCSCAVADQHRDALHAPRLTRLDDEPRLETGACAHEMVVNRRDREQRRHRHALRACFAVGEHEHVDTRGERGVGLRADARKRRVDAAGAFDRGPREVDRACAEDVRVDSTKPLELLVAQDRVVDHELPRMLRRLVEQVSLRPDKRLLAHHDRLADRVDRRIRHLREELLEVGVEERPAIREHGERRVVPHRADGLFGVRRERRQHHLHVLLRVAEQQLQAAKRLRERTRLRWRQVVETNVLGVEPGAVGAARCDLGLHLAVGHDPSLREIDQEQPAGLEPSLPHDLRGRHVEDARLRRKDHPAVLRLEPSPRSEAVPVERRTDRRAVGERDRRRAIPGLGQALVEAVEAAEVVRHIGPARVRLGDHHHQRVRERTPGEGEQFEHVVEHRGVGTARADHRQNLLHVLAEQLRREL